MIRMATNADGPTIGRLAQENGFDVEGLDWSDIEPYWLVAENGHGVVGAIQVAPGKPCGRLEMLAIDPKLEGFERGRVVKALLDQGYATLAVGGAQFALGLIPFELKSYKRVLKKRAAVVVASGNLMAKRLK